MMSHCFSQLKDTSDLSLSMWWVMDEEAAAFLECILFIVLSQNILIKYRREPNKYVFNQLKNETKTKVNGVQNN